MSAQPIYEVREVLEGAGASVLLYASPSFLDACDTAFDIVDRDGPAALEIVRELGGERETVWSYARDRAGEPLDLTAVFGYPVTRWTGVKRFEPR